MTPTKIDVSSSAEAKVRIEISKEKQEIMDEIARLEKELESVKGTTCEVYSRIVGYFRPVKQFNPGQEAQYHDRKTFEIK